MEIEIIETSFEWELPPQKRDELTFPEFEDDGDVSGKSAWELMPFTAFSVLGVTGIIAGALTRIFVS